MSTDRRRQGFAKAKQAAAGKGKSFGSKGRVTTQVQPRGAAWEKPNGDDPRAIGGVNAQPAPGGYAYGADPRRGVAKAKAQGKGKSFKGRAGGRRVYGA